ncbi:MAG TPA: spermidine synthase [Actinomycetota bacterium]
MRLSDLARAEDTAGGAVPEPGIEAGRAGDRRRLFLASFLMLFVELVLIRWLGANVAYLSFFSNFVLLGSFLGIGIGFLRGGRSGWFRWSPLLLAGVMALSAFFPVTIDRTGSDVIFFGSYRASGLPIWVSMPVVFAAVAATMAAVAQGVASLFERFPALEAYRLDILGSVTGVATFGALSLLGAPPAVWGIVIVGAFATLLWPRFSLVHAIALGLFAFTFAGDAFGEAAWSPYYRITWQADDAGVLVNVNGIPHQTITTLEARREAEPTYFVPYERMVVPPERVLVVGAGTGTDVAIALAAGASHVDAVEIDPRLAELGRDLHPERPYDDPRVRVVVDDGRAFLHRTDARYDLIVFALTDSLTLVSGQSSVRLESYLFTREAMEEAREHLAPGGVFAMYNYYRYPWLADRLANTVDEVYGHRPCFDSTRQVGFLALITIGLEPDGIACPSLWTSASGTPVEPATDDRPFVYLREAAVPSLYLLTVALILAASAVAVRIVSGPFRAMRSCLDLFFMGAAFLLLETKSVVQFALLFGTTWFVNALVFAGILLSVLLAIEVAKRARPNPVALYAILAGALAVAYAIPASALLELSVGPRFAAAVALAFAPVFCANLVFAERFQIVERPTVAFGANLLGAMVGGTLEYASLVSGYRSLLVVVAALYGLAFLSGRRYLGRAA